MGYDMARGTNRSLPGYQRLTKREWALIKCGHLTTNRSAKELGVKPSTVVTMRATIRRKLGVWDRTIPWRDVIESLPQYPEGSL
jgi:DNA-binding NarL/FixJ family response regulator